MNLTDIKLTSTPSWKRLRGGIIAAALMLVGVTTGCADRNTQFAGLWVSTEDVELSWIEGKVELAIGHFGDELTGVVYFLKRDGIQPDPTCACSFIDNKSTDLDGATFVASTTDCSGAVLALMLGLEDRAGLDTVLVGTVLDTESQDSVEVTFTQQSDFVADDRKVCP